MALTESERTMDAINQLVELTTRMIEIQQIKLSILNDCIQKGGPFYMVIFPVASYHLDIEERSILDRIANIKRNGPEINKGEEIGKDNHRS